MSKLYEPWEGCSANIKFLITDKNNNNVFEGKTIIN